MLNNDDKREALTTLLDIYDLWTAPLDLTNGREEFQNHPRVAATKWDLENVWIADLDRRISSADADASSEETRAEFRRIANRDLVPDVYHWIADEASWEELVRFLAIEGGPDAGFDDLVAQCQVGIHGVPKLALARNYWDEMGRGSLQGIHTILHDQLVDAVDMPRIPRDELPTSALERIALGGLLATNRRLQPEMIGALGLIEMQAGPRCRAVVKGLRRLNAPEGAFPFYEEHAIADPRHGKEWLDDVVEPLSRTHPTWGPRLLRGARWRAEVNRRFFADVTPAAYRAA